jgi:hypothetical protein
MMSIDSSRDQRAIKRHVRGILQELLRLIRALPEVERMGWSSRPERLAARLNQAARPEGLFVEVEDIPDPYNPWDDDGHRSSDARARQAHDDGVDALRRMHVLATNARVGVEKMTSVGAADEALRGTSLDPDEFGDLLARQSRRRERCQAWGERRWTPEPGAWEPWPVVEQPGLPEFDPKLCKHCQTRSRRSLGLCRQCYDYRRNHGGALPGRDWLYQRLASGQVEVLAV